MKNKFLFILIICSNLFAAEGNYHVPDLSIGYVIPFIGMLLSIAVFPLVAPHFWEKNYGKISAVWALSFYIPFLFTGVEYAIHELFLVLFTEYFPFIILLFSLYTVSGGILLKGSLVGSPKVNLSILAIGTLLSSIMGTTGSAMLLIRPLLRANKIRKNKIHTIVFFIFLVANIGGSLTPLGDPPLFLGFLEGVEFFWTAKNMFLPMITLSVILLVLYYFVDSYFYKKENIELNQDNNNEKLAIKGSFNFILIFGIVGAVLMSGMEAFKFDVINIVGVGISKGNAMRDLILIAMALLSLMFTKKEFRSINGFTWHPIEEVAKLFIGIFITIIPAIHILKQTEFDLSLSGLFWLTGILSAFLDNAPTYLVFFNAMKIDSNIINSGLDEIMTLKLLSISMGAVFMGAMTYIGNAPNFMVKSIAEENGVKMPSFFGYILWSAAILIPCFIIVNLFFIILV